MRADAKPELRRTRRAEEADTGDASEICRVKQAGIYSKKQIGAVDQRQGAFQWMPKERNESILVAQPGQCLLFMRNIKDEIFQMSI